MKKKLADKIGYSAILFVLAMIFPRVFAATFSISVTPYEGGYDLRFGKVSPALGRVNKELTVNITSDITKQYRVIQQLLEPLTTPEGGNIPQANFVVYGIRGTNGYGTLNVEQEIPVSIGRQVIYTANQTGTPDSFTLVYGLIPSPEMEPGSYRGRIAFTLEPIDSSQSTVNVILNIFAEAEVESAIEIKTALETKNIVLRSDREDAKSCDVTINIKGGFGRQFQILQTLTEQPVSSDGKLLDWEAVNFICRDAQKGIAISEPTPLSNRQQIIYTSSPRGEADSFTITYNLADLSGQKSGRYRARIKYFLEGVGATPLSLIDVLELEIENPNIFDLILTPEMGGLIQFRGVKPLEPAKRSELIVEVKSNANKKYQVVQKVTSGLTSREGNAIPAEHFTLKTESLETKGALKFPQTLPVKSGESVLFVSDDKGSSDKFKVIYELSLPVNYRAGDYSTSIVYSLSEI